MPNLFIMPTNSLPLHAIISMIEKKIILPARLWRRVLPATWVESFRSTLTLSVPACGGDLRLFQANVYLFA